MKTTPQQVEVIASLLTEDPDIINEEILVEWLGGLMGSGSSKLPPTLQLLSKLSGINDPKMLAVLDAEYQKFILYRPKLQQQGDEAAISAFMNYKKTGEMPGGSSNLDSRGGRDFRPEGPDQVVTPGRLRRSS